MGLSSRFLGVDKALGLFVCLFSFGFLESFFFSLGPWLSPKNAGLGTWLLWGKKLRMAGLEYEAFRQRYPFDLDTHNYLTLGESRWLSRRKLPVSVKTALRASCEGSSPCCVLVWEMRAVRNGQSMLRGLCMQTWGKQERICAAKAEFGSGGSTASLAELQASAGGRSGLLRFAHQLLQKDEGSEGPADATYATNAPHAADADADAADADASVCECCVSEAA